MDSRIRAHIRSNVVGYIALVVAVAGVPTAWAVSRNSIGSPQIKKAAVKASDLADNSVSSPKVVDESLTGADIAEGTLGQVPSAQHADSAASADQASPRQPLPARLPQTRSTASTPPISCARTPTRGAILAGRSRTCSWGAALSPAAASQRTR